METKLTSTSATGLAWMIRERRVSSLEVIDAHLRRIDEVNQRIHAVVQMDADQARADARAADEAIARGDDVGPLYGVPFTVKDWIETEGMVCAAGFAERADYVPKRDATVVARMRAAGAIVLGKTNVNDGRPLYERPRNPYDLDRTPGASSSGEAAIIAAGGSPLGLGSDSGGSLRWPAHCCGIATLKPTSGLVPNTGHFPRIGALSDPRTAIGPLARSVDDLALTLRVIAGPDFCDPGAVPVPLGDIDRVELRGLRVATYVDAPGAKPSSTVVDATRAAASALEGAGAIVEEATPPRLDEALAITHAYWARPESTSLSEWRPPTASTLTADDVERSLFEWDRLRRDVLQFMQRFDVIVCPVAADIAPELRDPRDVDFIYTLPYSLTGYPVAVVRAGTSGAGMPVGVQVVARSWCDQVALAAARCIERACGGWVAPEL